ncbi:rhodanese-like domain-containing protein [Prosthecobacter dejongeii]|uniref:Rhodanese-related sulfurtransferase n=1 Tax=Prosthecobacter dejongeii TaxID=48465 RepID=A0A7W7YLM8_9BACT|nr:rhodanese-like domain-containing protein [Prosthecobacter dejongeii]MBB5038500.1 rhodanese-related sulfurtransferase [Prosthecobacter dejongeii]
MLASLHPALYALVGMGAVALLLWWFMDHRRGTAWAISVVRERFPDVAQLSVDGVERLLAGEVATHPVLLDARSAEEYAVSHLPGALSLPVKTVTDEALRELATSAPYVVYCSAGYRACELARRLHQAGIHQVQNLEGGIFAWANAGQPVHRAGQPVKVVHTYHRLFSRLLKPERRQP